MKNYPMKDLLFPGGATTVWYGQKNLNLAGKIHYGAIVAKAYSTVNRFYRKAIKEKECYYGPFKGEFGHFLLHNLPFLSHLGKQGVKIHYCGMELHEAFLRDESGKSIIHEWFPLRDFFGEVKPRANEIIPPADVCEKIRDFRQIALASGKAFLDISDNNMYWYVFRNWQLKGKQAHFDYSKTYHVEKENAVTIFPRKKGNAFTPNNGGPWNFNEIAEAVSPFFDKVYITGHPDMSDEVKETDKIRLRLSYSNEDVIRSCAASQLIITQHSGAIHMGAYTNTDVLVIFNGKPPIKGLIDSIRFRKNLDGRPLHFAFDLEEIVDYTRKFAK